MAASVGLDIGTEAVRLAAVDGSRGRLILRRYGAMPLPEGAVVAGEVVDEGAVTEAVAALFKRVKVSRKRVVVGVANQRVIVRQVDVPQMAEAELIESLPFQVQDAIPIPVDEALLDYVPVEEFVTPEGEPMLSILVVAAQREMVDGITRVTDGAGVSLRALDLIPFALVRSVLGSDPGIEGTEGVVDIGGSITQIVLVRNGVARFVRILPRGGEDFTTALADGLSIEREEAEALKRRVGVDPVGSPTTGEGDEDLARRLLTRQADAFVEEVRSSVDYHLSQGGSRAISRLVVAGNGARLPHLANRLGRALGARIEPARVLESVELGRVELSQEATSG